MAYGTRSTTAKEPLFDYPEVFPSQQRRIWTRPGQSGRDGATGSRTSGGMVNPSTAADHAHTLNGGLYSGRTKQMITAASSGSQRTGSAPDNDARASRPHKGSRMTMTAPAISHAVESWIPSRLRTILKRNQNLDNATLRALMSFSSCLSTGPLTFFPDYTDHGPQHISDVLHTAAELIEPTARSVLTPQDVAAFTIAVLLHDIAMHVQPDGFTALVSQDSRCKPIDGFDDRPWSEAWSAFVQEARRFDSRTNISLFGDPYGAAIPRLGSAAWTERHRRLVGEFIRRHHARLAHEIALGAFPGPTGTHPISLPSDLDSVADIAGVIGRAHGTHPQVCLRYVREHYANNTIDPHHVHVAYLIALLRVSDYLQLDETRADNNRLRVQSLRGPESMSHWRGHQAVKQIGPDPHRSHTLLFLLETKSVQTWSHLRHALDGLSEELHDANDLIEENCSYHEKDHLDRLQLRYRSIRHNLDGLKSHLDITPLRHIRQATALGQIALIAGPDSVSSTDHSSISRAIELFMYAFNRPLATARAAVRSAGRNVPRRLPGKRSLALVSDLRVISSGLGLVRGALKNVYVRALGAGGARA